MHVYRGHHGKPIAHFTTTISSHQHNTKHATQTHAHPHYPPHHVPDPVGRVNHATPSPHDVAKGQAKGHDGKHLREPIEGPLSHALFVCVVAVPWGCKGGG